MTTKFSCNNDYVLENDCVLLRPLVQDDCKYLLEFSLNETDTWKYGLVTAAGKDNLEKYIAEAVTERQLQKMYAFIVFDKRTNQYAGSTRFYDINLPFNTMQLGYTWYGERFRGTKLNENCKYLLLQFAFEQLGLHRVEFRADNKNARSIAAMKKIGCIPEGILREHMPTLTGGRRSSLVLSILQSEWHADVKQKLDNLLK